MATDLRRPAAALDSRSFDGFYRRHLGEIYRFVLQDVGNRADAEEVTQTAFLDAFRALRRGHEPAMPRAWMYGIARNATRRRFRTLSRRPREVELGPAVVEELAEPEEGPRVDAVRSAFGDLKPNHREVLFLREVEGLTYAEIAERMRLSAPAVETLLFRARRSLRELLEAEGLRPAVRPSRVKSLKGLALLPAVFLNRLSDRLQHLVSPELATKTAGAVAAVALGAGVVVGTQSLVVGAAPGGDEAARAASGARPTSISAPKRLDQTVAPTSSKVEPKRLRSAKGARGERQDRSSKQPSGPPGGGSTAGGGSIATPPVSVPSVTPPQVDVPEVPAPPVATPPVEAPPVEVPQPPVDVPPVEGPPVDLPPVDLPPVDLPPVDLPPVEVPPVEPPVDAGGLIGG